MSTWPKKITVDKRIVGILSESTYDSFPNALKELVSNSYDADASNVDINIDEKKEVITVSDDGIGMSENEFDFYIRIAGRKRDKKGDTPSGRKIIGQFGVGFLSVFPFFKNYYIETKKNNSNEVLYANIPCYSYFTSNRLINISDINIEGGIKYDNKNYSKSYTKIRLTGFTNIGKAFFRSSHDYKPRRNSVNMYSSLDKLRWRLSEDLPILYESSKFNFIFKLFSPRKQFNVNINKVPLLRKVYGKEILESNWDRPMTIGKIKLFYFIVTDRESVSPYEARYLKIRNLNAGVGYRTTFGLGTEVGGARSRLHWLSGEIIILDGLNNLITVSRDNFNFDPDFERLKEFLIVKLSYYSNRLEDAAEIQQFITQNSNETKITNVKLLDKEVIQSKIEKLGKLGKNFKEDISEKRLFVDNKTYKVNVDEWAYENSRYPACKVTNNRITINKSYPLFKNKKYADIFIKLHLMLIKNYENGTFSKHIYDKLTTDILDYYEDYL